MNDIEKHKKDWRSAGPFKNAGEAISHPSFNKMHKAIRASKSKALEKAKEAKPTGGGFIKGKWVDSYAKSPHGNLLGKTIARRFREDR